MLDWVLKTSLVIIGNILFKVSYVWTNVFAFDRWKRYFSEASFDRSYTRYVFVKIIKISKYVVFIVISSNYNF